MQSVGRLTLLLCCLWAASLLYGEWISYHLPLLHCSWPIPTSSSSSTSALIKEGSSRSNITRIAVIADPQLEGRTSHGFRLGSFALWAVRFYSDLYMLRSFQQSVLPFDPHMILFMGDYFDGGHVLSDEEWVESLMRLKQIFGFGRRGEKLRTQVKYVVGNHDIGYSGFHIENPQVIDRYEKEFGPRNYIFHVGDVDFLVVDAQSLDDPSQGVQYSSTWSFIKNISSDGTSKKRVLLTHIPLYRSNETPCGQYRSSPIINQRTDVGKSGQGFTYQNYVSEESSNRILELIKPILVLSGHDHDQCNVTHKIASSSITEITLGTVSWQQRNVYPSFMLLSVNTRPQNISTKDDVVSAQLCFLPKQTHIYIWYLILLVISLSLLTFWPTNGLQFFEGFTNTVKRIARESFSSGGKLKDDDDDDCDYEMVWDAEGSMHLVKKASGKVNNVKTGTVDAWSTGRSNAVLRTSAKKQITVDVISDSLLPESNTKGTRNKMSKTRAVILRLLRVIKSVLILAVVNFPLYVLLLFKDWIVP